MVLDLACGPGSLTDRLLRGIPGAHIIAVDLDPLLVAVGKAALGDAGGRLTWREANLSDRSWHDGLASRPVDAIVSTTALHWLEVDALLALYRDCGALIRESGVLLNGDQMEHPPSAASATPYRYFRSSERRRHSRDRAWSSTGTSTPNCGPGPSCRRSRRNATDASPRRRPSGMPDTS